MAVLLDTGVLLRAFDKDAKERDEILKVIRTSWQRGETLVVTLQNLAEFWNVSTRPKDKNGFGLSPEVAARRLRTIERIAVLHIESAGSYAHWKRLVVSLKVLGVKAHDARLVSVMLQERVSTLVTLNERDFDRYLPEGIVVSSPAKAAAKF